MSSHQPVMSEGSVESLVGHLIRDTSVGSCSVFLAAGTSVGQSDRRQPGWLAAVYRVHRFGPFQAFMEGLRVRPGGGHCSLRPEERYERRAAVDRTAVQRLSPP